MDYVELSPEEKQFNDESNFLDSLYEFHPDIFIDLNRKEQEVVKMYYLIGSKEQPDNIFSYRTTLIRKQPSIVHDAQLAFNKILTSAGIEKFERSSPST